MAPEKMVKAIEQGMIHLANEGTFGGSTALLRVAATRRRHTAGAGRPGRIPDHPDLQRSVKVRPVRRAGPRTHNGWTIRGPGVESWYPVGGKPPAPLIST